MTPFGDTIRDSRMQYHGHGINTTILGAWVGLGAHHIDLIESGEIVPSEAVKRRLYQALELTWPDAITAEPRFPVLMEAVLVLDVTTEHEYWLVGAHDPETCALVIVSAGSQESVCSCDDEMPCIHVMAVDEARYRRQERMSA